jgi:hypothetical protein
MNPAAVLSLGNSRRRNASGGVLPAQSSIGLTLACVCWCAAAASAADASPPQRLKRSESFLGLHLDFHATAEDREIGRRTTPELVHAILDRVRPDYIQVDCKGHAGFSSYPTQVGNRAGGFAGDPLRVWREVTAQRGVALYLHYSGVWDAKAVQDHPEWAVVGPDGARNAQKASVFGPYADRLLIPQLLELARDYGVDGAWIDGECWATTIDYGPEAQQAFQAATGIAAIPRGPGDPHWFAWTEFHREAFRDYLRHYLREIKRSAPDFQVASNWAFSDHMPEPVCCPVDFISGDYPHSNSVVAARYSSRFMSTQGVPWDLMAWSFSTPQGGSGWTQKSAVQLMREAACVLPQGGGFQAYYTQNRDGSLDLEKLSSMEQTAKFCRERQAVSFRSRAVPQIALLCNTAAHYRRASERNLGLFPRSIDWQRPLLNHLLDNQYSVEVFAEKNLLPVLGDYPLVVVGEWEYYAPEVIAALVAYVEGGGRLLLVGEQIFAHFAAAFAHAEPDDRPLVAHVPADAPLKRFVCRQGRLAVWGRNFSSGDVSVDDVRAAVEALDPPLLVEVSGSRHVDVSVRTTADEQLAVHLVNTSGDHQTAGILTEVAPVGPLEIALRLDARPAGIALVPEQTQLSFAYEDGVARLTLERLDIHAAIVVDNAAPE